MSGIDQAISKELYKELCINPINRIILDTLKTAEYLNKIEFTTNEIIAILEIINERYEVNELHDALHSFIGVNENK